MRRHATVLILGLLPLLAGCSLRPSLRQLAELERVGLAPVSLGTVQYSGTLPSEYGSDDRNGLLSFPLFAPIGIVVELVRFPETQRRKSERLQLIFEKLDIDVRAIVQREFTRELRECGLFPELRDGEVTGATEVHPQPGAAAEARFQLEVSYGVSGGMFFDAKWEPWLELSGRLTDCTGETIWRKSVAVEAGEGGVRELPFPDPFASRSQVRERYTQAARVAARRLRLHLTGGS